VKSHVPMILKVAERQTGKIRSATTNKKFFNVKSKAVILTNAQVSMNCLKKTQSFWHSVPPGIYISNNKNKLLRMGIELHNFNS
jgi:hypothetical protein